MKEEIEKIVNALWTELNDKWTDDFVSALENAYPQYVFKFDGVDKWFIASEI